MGKSFFTIIFLILALIITDQVKTFVRNNRPKTVQNVQASSTYQESTTTNAYDDYIKRGNREYIYESNTNSLEVQDVAI
jgi:hypothetical protein